MSALIAPDSKKCKIIMFGDSLLSAFNFGDLLVYFASVNKIDLSIVAVTYDNRATGLDYSICHLIDPEYNSTDNQGFEYSKFVNAEDFKAVLGDKNYPADLLMLQTPRTELFDNSTDKDKLKKAYTEVCGMFKTAYPDSKILFVMPPVFSDNISEKNTKPFCQKEQQQMIKEFAETLTQAVADSFLFDMQEAHDYFESQPTDICLHDSSCRHISAQGAYYNACTVFSHIFNISCANTGFYGILPEETALGIQNTAHTYIFGSKCEKLPLKTDMLPHTETPDPRFASEVIPDIVKPLIATAKAYYNRGAMFQYDMSSLDRVNYTGAWRRDMRIAPEEACPQYHRHLDCSCLVYNCFYHTYGFRLEKADDTKGMIKRDDLFVFYWDASTGEPMQDAINRFIKTIRPGDAIVFRKNNEHFGHTMLYIGNGWIIHSTGHNFSGAGSNYSYDGGFDNRELIGTVRYDELDIFAMPWGSRFMFGPTDRVAIMRPTEKAGIQCATEQAIARMNNLEDIVSYKLTSAPLGISVNPGDEVTFTFVVKNIGSVAKTVSVTDILSDSLSLKSVCGMSQNNGTLSAQVTAEAGQTATVSYTAIVDKKSPYGTIIECANAAIGGVRTNRTDILVGNTLSAVQRQKLSAYGMSEYYPDGLELAKRIYKDALGYTLPIEHPKQIYDAIFEECINDKNNKYFVSQTDDSIIKSMLVHSLIGGTAFTTPRNHPVPRLKTMHKDLFIVGDMLVSNSTLSPDTAEIWICTDANEFMSAKNGEIVKVCGFESFMLLDTVLGKKTFCVLRPSLIMQ